MGMHQAVSTSGFIASIGVNTHLDFTWVPAYAGIQPSIAALNYLGVKNVRDNAQLAADVGTTGRWQQVADATGVKFDDYMAEGSVAQMQAGLVPAQLLAAQGILNFIEGGNEEDDPFATQQGNSLLAAAAFQQQVYAVGHALGLPVINMSFGQGWTAANHWHGDYDKVGDLSAYADYANAHTYLGSALLSNIQLLNTDAKIAATQRPVITTELGFHTVSGDPAAVARNTLEGLLDCYQQGDVKTYIYALFDDPSGNYGLMNADGTPKLAGAVLHNMIALLTDGGTGAGSFAPGSLDYTLVEENGDQSLLMQKSDGSDWLAVWNETGVAHSVSLALATNAGAINVFDPMTGVGAIQSVAGTNSISVSLSSNPLLIEIVPALGPHDLTVTVPAGLSVGAGGTVAVAGISISDPWAANHAGRMALNVSDRTGSFEIAGQAFGPGRASFSGTLAQLNADLTSLKYTPGGSAGGDTLTVDVWNQAGIEVTKEVAITVTAASLGLAPMAFVGGGSSQGQAANLPVGLSTALANVELAGNMASVGSFAPFTALAVGSAAPVLPLEVSGFSIGATADRPVNTLTLGLQS